MRRLPPIALALGLAWLATPVWASSPPVPADSTVDPVAVRLALQRREFGKLEVMLHAARLQGDDALGRFFAIFRHLDGAQSHALRAWAEERSGSAPALIALATHEVQLGWNARGKGGSSDVSERGWAGLKAHAGWARELLERALAKDPSWMDGWARLIEVGRQLGKEEIEQSAFERGLAVRPDHLDLWYERIYTEMRRWGGSKEAQLALAQAAQQHAERNPRLRALLGFPYYDLARDLRAMNRDEQTLSALDRALAFGEHTDYRELRYRTLTRMERYEEALADTDRMLELDPYDAIAHWRRAWVLERLDRFEEGSAAIDEAARLRPSEPGIRELQGWFMQAAPFAAEERAWREQPTMLRAVQRATTWMYFHALEGLTVTALLWAVWRFVRRLRLRRRGIEPVDALRPGEARYAPLTWMLIRSYMMVALLYFLFSFSTDWVILSNVQRFVDLPLTFVGLAGAFGFAWCRRLVNAGFWRIFAWLLPLWNVVFEYGIGRPESPYCSGIMWIGLLLGPIYVALFMYAYGSRELWKLPEAYRGGGTAPPTGMVTAAG